MVNKKILFNIDSLGTLLKNTEILDEVVVYSGCSYTTIIERLRASFLPCHYFFGAQL